MFTLSLDQKAEIKRKAIALAAAKPLTQYALNIELYMKQSKYDQTNPWFCFRFITRGFGLHFFGKHLLISWNKIVNYEV